MSDLQITKIHTHDVRYPTSDDGDGSDAMNPECDYSAAYCVVETNDPRLQGHGFSFTIGRGNEIVVLAIQSLAPLLIGREMQDIISDMSGFWMSLVRGDSQIRWLGECGAVHLARGALINAVWDLWARMEGKPLWRLLVDMPPEQLVSCIPFTYITDALTKEEAIKMLVDMRADKAEFAKRMEFAMETGVKSYTTSAGWLGYSEEKVKRLCQEAVDQGFTHIKIKVGRDLSDDIKRCKTIRDVIGYDVAGRHLMVDANQYWDVEESIEWMKKLAFARPLWIEEPTAPDDILGHATIAKSLRPLGIGIATGEHCQNRVVFKQLLQADAIDFVQVDAARMAGVNECLAVYLLAKKFNKPVCPHAGGVGLCELVQHLSFFDFICVAGTQEGRVTEFVDHLHEEFVAPCVVKRGYYTAPSKPGYSAEIKAESLAKYAFDGDFWKARLAQKKK